MKKSMAQQKKQDSMKRSKTPPPVAKQRRHLNVVGGTTSVPSLREAHRRRNPHQPKQQRSEEEKAPTPVLVIQPKKRSSSAEHLATGQGLCAKVQKYWSESEKLSKKTMLGDVIIRSSDGQRFNCNSFVVGVWSIELLKQARRDKKRGREEWVADVDCSGEILESALRFMYGGRNKEIPPSHMSEIIILAENYKIPDLKRACYMAANTIPLSTDNASAVWLFAEENNLQEAAKRAMRFIYTNLEKVVKEEDWNRVSHNVGMLLQLLKASAEWTTDNTDFRPSRMDDDELEMPNALAQGIHAVWRDSNELSKSYGHSDKTITTKNGRQFHVHSQIIYARSPEFASFLHTESDQVDDHLVHVEDMDDDVVEEFLRYLYRQQTSIAFPKLAEFVLVMASQYDILELAEMCEREMASQQVTSVDKALKMLSEAEEHRMGAAKLACFRFLYDKVAELRDQEDWNKMVHDEPQLLIEMMLESKKFRRMKSVSASTTSNTNTEWL